MEGIDLKINVDQFFANIHFQCQPRDSLHNQSSTFRTASSPYCSIQKRQILNFAKHAGKHNRNNKQAKVKYGTVVLQNPGNTCTLFSVSPGYSQF